ncbi:MAG: ABC transporter permease [Pseudopedobacter saltans]|uniref:ABC transporter permease n=1 Tax=Pseudopedobacter saltans TaxID=151895 RepID=A0A2W5GZ24_9SPHI|nr:MAG: ABC transporter permease [Pseudopedobacter saltans]
MQFLFAWRYFKSKKTTNVINIIAWISVVAIAVGTAALIVILSVFNGFEALVKSLYSDFYADMSIRPKMGKLVRIDQKQIGTIMQTRGVKAYSLQLEEKAMLRNGDIPTMVFLKGVDKNYNEVTNIKPHIFDGTYDLGSTDEPGILLGVGVQSALSVSLKSPQPLTIFLPNYKADNFSDVQSSMNSFEINQTGIFRIQEDFDNKYALTNIGFVRYMLNLDDDQYSSMELKLQPNIKPEDVKKELIQKLGKNYDVKTRYEQNQSLFSIMQMEKWIIYAILSLILIIAAFNMIGALTMLVLEKRKDIAVLKAMGADSSVIRGIFMKEGILLGCIGGMIGVLLALGICFLQLKFHLLKLGGGSFIIDYYPVKLSVVDFVLVCVTVFCVAVIAAWLPARRAAAQNFSLKS